MANVFVGPFEPKDTGSLVLDASERIQDSNSNIRLKKDSAHSCYEGSEPSILRPAGKHLILIHLTTSLQVNTKHENRMHACKETDAANSVLNCAEFFICQVRLVGIFPGDNAENCLLVGNQYFPDFIDFHSDLYLRDMNFGQKSPVGYLIDQVLTRY